MRYRSRARATLCFWVLAGLAVTGLGCGGSDDRSKGDSEPSTNVARDGDVDGGRGTAEHSSSNASGTKDERLALAKQLAALALEKL